MEMSIPALLFLGVTVGAFGTLVGAGGGSLLVPVLLILYPQMEPDVITAISLAVVFLNATSGSVAYGWMKKTDYRTGWVFAAATVPGAILGVFAVNWLSRWSFDLLFGTLLLGLSLYLLIFPGPETTRAVFDCIPRCRLWPVSRSLVDAKGEVYDYSFCLGTGILASFVVGFVSSLLGIGGGIIHVPALIYLLHFPPHVATATSHFILAMMALTGCVTHLLQGTYSGVLSMTLTIGVGAVIGAQVGAALSQRVSGLAIVRSLGLALGVVGVRLLLLVV
jgi:uncharacterized membrane protein YfcA